MFEALKNILPTGSRENQSREGLEFDPDESRAVVAAVSDESIVGRGNTTDFSILTSFGSAVVQGGGMNLTQRAAYLLAGVLSIAISREPNEHLKSALDKVEAAISHSA